MATKAIGSASSAGKRKTSRADKQNRADKEDECRGRLHPAIDAAAKRHPAGKKTPGKGGHSKTGHGKKSHAELRFLRARPFFAAAGARARLFFKASMRLMTGGAVSS